jgi:hypothetical protein
MASDSSSGASACSRCNIATTRWSSSPTSSVRFPATSLGFSSH